jgi:lipopolysaccharide heptosyltransferase I
MTRPSSTIARLNPDRICVIKPSSLGDVIHSLPILAALRERWPSVHIAWVVNRGYHDVLRGHRALDELIVHDRVTSPSDPLGIKGTAALFRQLKRGRFDLTIDLQCLLRSALMTAATAAPVRLGMADAREGARWFYTHRVDASRMHVHAVDRVMRVARFLDAGGDSPRFDLPISPEDERWAERAISGLPSPRIVLNLGARWLTKRWPPAHFAEIARRAHAEFGAGVIAVGAREDRESVDSLAKSICPPPLLDLCGQTTLLKLGALARAANVFVSNDTGPLHLAAAAGARVVGIYTCTDPVLTGPFGPHAVTVKSCVWCAPSFIRKCDRLECMTELSPDRVWPTVKRQLEESLGAKRHSAA